MYWSLLMEKVLSKCGGMFKKNSYFLTESSRLSHMNQTTGENKSPNVQKAEILGTIGTKKQTPIGYPTGV